jgi:methylenetetrahydrofolate dehydrogenase (NADP+)/methenyltetrahydrofolate cyclohydrolase
MIGKRLDGRVIAEQIRSELANDVIFLKETHDVTPGLAVVLVGNNPASLSYVNAKTDACKKLGVESLQLNFDEETDTESLLDEIETLNVNPNIHGILVQLPLPNQREDQVINRILPEKDVDGLHPVNLGRLMRGEEGFFPCTPYGVLEILYRSGIEVSGKHAVVVGRSSLVGRPIANLLSQKMDMGNATVTLCHTGTPDVGQYTRQADILIVATGQPKAITCDMVKNGAVVIDVGVNRVEDRSRERGWRLVGDVDYNLVRKKVAAITPVPNGVGPMTITMLLHNVIKAAKNSIAGY